MRTQDQQRRLVSVSPVVAADRQCSRCKRYYDIASPAASYEHNNNLCTKA